MSKQNCWEFKKCGREPGGVKTAELGVCPAATTEKANGLNSGRNGGRACWAIAANGSATKTPVDTFGDKPPQTRSPRTPRHPALP